MDNKVLAFEDLSYTEHENVIFDHLDFTLESGEIHAVMSGRSYDLSNFSDLVSGVYELPDRIFIDSHMQNYRELKKHSYSVTPHTALFPEFSIPHNLFLHSVLGAHKKTVEVFHELGITISPRAKVEDLSQSERKLLEIVRGYTRNTKIMMLYETLYHIDGKLQNSAIALIRRIADKGTGILYLTSKLEDALLVADRISVIENGRVIGCYSTAQVRKSPKHMMRLMAGLDTELMENSETLEVLGAIVGTREMIDSTTELKTQILKYSENIKKLLAADFCCISVIDTLGKSILVDSQEGSRLPEMVVRTILKDPVQETVIIQDAKQAFDQEIPCDTLVCVPIRSQEESKDKGCIIIGYAGRYQYTKKDELLLSTLTKDILITLEAARLKTRSLLLQESNHRIKNNLQMIISLLYMKKRTLKNMPLNIETVNALISDIVSRIKSIALVHEILTLNGEYNNSIVQLNTIVEGIAAFYNSFQVEIVISSDKIMLEYDKATFIALIINELISNSIKHAFAEDSDGNQIQIVCREISDYVEIRVSDNGVGISQEKLSNLQAAGCGMQIVRLATTSIGGTTEYKVEHGTTVCIKTPKENLFSQEILK